MKAKLIFLLTIILASLLLGGCNLDNLEGDTNAEKGFDLLMQAADADGPIVCRLCRAVESPRNCTGVCGPFPP